MEKPFKMLFLLAFTMLLAGGSIILTPARATTLESSTYYPIVYNSVGSGNYQNNTIFFSTYWINGTKYFSIGCNPSTKDIDIVQYDNLGYAEITRSYDIIAGGIGYQCSGVGNNAMLDYWNTIGVIFPIINNAGNLMVLSWNSTAWIEGNNGITVLTNNYIVNGITTIPQYVSISKPMNPSVYNTNTGGGGYITEITTTGFTFAVSYQNATDSAQWVHWSFYDLDDGTNTTGKYFKWDAGMTDISRTYVTLSGQNCFSSTNCIFDMLYQGKTAYNGNRLGVYVREVGYDLWGHTVNDKGLWGIDSAINFMSGQLSNVDWWRYFTEYPFTEQKIYIHATTPYRTLAYIEYGAGWSYLTEGSINMNANSGLQASPLELPLTNGADCAVGGDWWNTYGYIIPNRTSDHVYLNMKMVLGTNSSCGAQCQVSSYYDIFINNYNNASQNVSIIGNSDSTTSPQTYSTTDKYFFDIPLNGTIAQGMTNITVKLKWSYGASTVCYTNKAGSDYHTVLDAIPYDFGKTVSTAGINPYGQWDLFITQSNIGETEGFFLITNTTTGGFTRTYTRGVDKYGVQAIQSACICNDWVTVQTNATTATRTRSCIPAVCAPEYQQYTNYSGGVTTTTVSAGNNITGGVPSNVFDPIVELRPAGDTSAIYTLADFLISTFMLSLYVAIAVAGFIAFKLGNSMVVFGIVMLVFILGYTIIGLFPIWFVLIFGVISAIVIAKMVGIIGG